MSLTASRDRLLDAVLGLLWAQWTELGVAGTVGIDATIIDPEALLAVTAEFGRYDPRLFDEVLDWLSRNSAALDVTRLRKVSYSMPGRDASPMAALVEFMRSRASDAKWSRAADRLAVREERAPWAPSTLFLDRSGQALPVLGGADTFFQKHGYLRSRLELRGMSAAPDLRRAALARLRLRALFGQGYRAEVLLYLMTHDAAHGRRIAERTAYSQRQVAEYLLALSEAGFAESWSEGNLVQYRLLVSLESGPEESAAYVDWSGAFRVVLEVWGAVAAAALAGDDYEASVVLRERLGGRGRFMSVEGLEVPRLETDRHPGPALASAVGAWVEELSARLDVLAGR